MSDLENFVKDLAKSLGMPVNGLTYSEALHIVKALADNQRERSDACANVGIGPFGALYHVVDDLQSRVAKLEEGSTSETKEKPFRLEQTAFPVSYHTEYRQAEQSKMNVRLLGMVALGETTTFMEPSVLDLHLRAESDTAQRLREAVVSKKKYKLILEETEETF
jgi:hypothetical protein